MARPTKLNADVQQKIVDALSAGNYFDAACEYAGITSRAGYEWMERARKELSRREGQNVKEGSQQWENEEPFVQFFHAVSRASANVEIRTIANIQKLGSEDWRALAWFMEHRYPTKWGKQVQELTGANGGAITYKLEYPDGTKSNSTD